MPINDKGNEFTEVDAVVINEHGVFVWDAKNANADCFYGKRENDKWYKSFDDRVKMLAEREISTGENDYRISLFPNPLKQNRMHVNAIQRQLRLNGFKNTHISLV